MIQVCVFGSANLDVVARAERHPRPGETLLGTSYDEHPGGKGLNQAVAAARAGAATAMLGAVGHDAAGDRLLAVLAGDGIDHAGVLGVDAPTGRAMIVVADDAENTIVVVPGANAEVQRAELPDCSVLLVQLEIPISAVSSALSQARERRITTILNPAPATVLGADVLALCDLVVPNEHELGALGGTGALLAAGVGNVVLTKGAAGVDVVNANETLHVAAFTVRAVDTTAAGDTFCGTLAAALAGGDDMSDAVHRAAAAAALATTRAGAVPSIPSADEVDAFLTRNGQPCGQWRSTSATQP
ncbi:MAG: ribokinase [Actinomycetota bacterium]|nr:ribokinase [Actinomycetota bacterium]